MSAPGPPLRVLSDLDYGSASVVGDTVWMAGGARAFLFGFGIDDGAVTAKVPFGVCTWARFNGPRCTPVIRDGMVYAQDYDSAPKYVESDTGPGVGLNEYPIRPSDAGMEVMREVRVDIRHARGNLSGTYAAGSAPTPGRLDGRVTAR